MVRSLPALLAFITVTLGQSATSRELRATRVQSACPDEATAAAADSLAAKFDNHQFVFIGSTHGDVKIEEFLMCLISRPSFKGRVTDIVEEQVSSADQLLVDRYVLGLDQIPADRVAAIWFDTDAPTLWTTLPQVRRFVETLRQVNSTLPPTNRIRLVGGNEGIDWAKVKTVDDLAPYPYKTNLIPHLLVEHLAKEPGNRTLVVYGDCHIHWKGSNFMSDLEAALGRERLFVVGRINQLVATERRFLNEAGNPDKPFFVTVDRIPSNAAGETSLSVCTGERSGHFAEYMDAFVYLGPTADRSTIGEIQLTAAEQRELARRSSIKADPNLTMRARFRGRDRWFAEHPNDLVPRPKLSGPPPS